MITGLCDEYPASLGKHREVFVACLLGGIYLCALPTCSYGGKDLVAMLNMFGSSTPILLVVFIETVGVFWFYGVSRFCDDVEMMIGERPGLFWRICWQFISPIFLLVILLFTVWDYCTGGLIPFKEGLKAQPSPSWLGLLGWCMTMSSLIWIPIFAIYKYNTTEGTMEQRLRKITQPEQFLPHSGSKDTRLATPQESHTIKNSINYKRSGYSSTSATDL